MRRHTNLKWERINGTYHLRVTSGDINVDYLKSLLDNVTMDRPDCGYPFSSIGSRCLHEWLHSADGRLREEGYCLLSNWFLTGSPGYQTSVRALYAGHLWDALFCVQPEKRLTSPAVGKNHKVVPAEFDRWWREQQRCQEESPIPAAEP